MWRKNPITRFLVWQFIAVHTFTIGRHANGCDLIHANWTLSAAAAIASRAYHHRPIVATLHGSDMVQATRLPFIRSVTREVLRRCDQVIAVSRFLANIATDLGVPASATVVIPDGVDTRCFTPGSSEREMLIIYVGSLIKIKGVEYLLQSVPLILQEFPDIKIAVIGEGPEKAELLRTSQSLGISSQVEFLGALPPAQVQEWMRRARVLVLPSIEEGLGVVLLEAMSSGTPCIASNTGGIPDIVTPDVGHIIPPAQPQALASAVNSILADKERWLRLSYNARIEAETKYSWPIIAQHLIHIYTRTLARQSRS
jgi:glycosyltransferase involved in cell wall biosynthesis